MQHPQPFRDHVEAHHEIVSLSGPLIFDRQRIPVGEYVEIDLRSFGDGLCWFDVLIVDGGSEEYVYSELNLCETPILTFDERDF